MNNGMRIITASALPSIAEPNAFYIIGTTLYLSNPDGAIVPFGTAPIVGQTTLVAGTKAVSVPGTSATSKAFVQLVSPLTASLTVERQAVCTTDTVTITALVAAKTINNVDVSIVNYVVYQ